MRHCLKRLALVAVAAAATLTLVFAQGAPGEAASTDLTLAAGAGYKKPVLDLIARFGESWDGEVNGSFGNMQQVIALAEASPEVALIIGDQRYLSGSALFTEFHPVGVGLLVVAWPKGSPAIDADTDLLDADVERIALPDAKMAIYGIAATEWLQDRGYEETLAPKLIYAATVPQVSAYLIAGEVDVGFINLTDAIGIQADIGGYRLLEDGYAPIAIVAAVVDGHETDPAVLAFLAFLGTPEAHAILEAYGL